MTSFKQFLSILKISLRQRNEFHICSFEVQLNSNLYSCRGNDLMRILSIAAFVVSGYASTEGRQCKLVNPLLGETYEADYPDKGLHFFSEKLDPVGVLTLQFEDGETFQWIKVTTSICNIILRKIYCDHYGTMRIKGSGNYSCKLKFKEQSIIDRNPHQVHGSNNNPKVYDPMTEVVLLWERDKSATKTRYNFTPFAISSNEITHGLREKLPPNDSRLRPDQRHLENGECELANAEKLRLEQLQRQAGKLQERGWRPQLFKMDENDSFDYVGGYWETREKKD
ncbi:hypothetical protein L6452_21844 [Arctium lappa]|uniref:Uncharacterized protein n=1 Tax=Arctium lappa TaxID=4217 RepID=A0ACB9AYI1_ARCLA|nr:hypothetical protein L6452_21844 [Arctium lappa]